MKVKLYRLALGFSLGIVGVIFLMALILGDWIDVLMAGALFVWGYQLTKAV